MPTAKPDTQEVNALRLKRGIRYSEPSAQAYGSTHRECEAAVCDGYVSIERAKRLLAYFQASPAASSIYPNNVLTLLLRDICAVGGWSDDGEHDLLHFIHSFYVGYEAKALTATSAPLPPRDLSYLLADTRLRSERLKEALASDYFDHMTTTVDLTDTFVGFTGKFESGTRAECFAEARRRGAVPCDPAPYMDFLFVSRELEDLDGISSKLDAAFFYRRVYGAPRVLREADWAVIKNDG